MLPGRRGHPRHAAGPAADRLRHRHRRPPPGRAAPLPPGHPHRDPPRHGHRALPGDAVRGDHLPGGGGVPRRAPPGVGALHPLHRGGPQAAGLHHQRHGLRPGARPAAGPARRGGRPGTAPHPGHRRPPGALPGGRAAPAPRLPLRRAAGVPHRGGDLRRHPRVARHGAPGVRRAHPRGAGAAAEDRPALGRLRADAGVRAAGCLPARAGPLPGGGAAGAALLRRLRALPLHLRRRASRQPGRPPGRPAARRRQAPLSGARRGRLAHLPRARAAVRADGRGDHAPPALPHPGDPPGDPPGAPPHVQLPGGVERRGRAPLRGPGRGGEPARPAGPPAGRPDRPLPHARDLDEPDRAGEARRAAAGRRAGPRPARPGGRRAGV